MTLCDNLILMYRGLYQYNHVLLKRWGTLRWSQALSRSTSWEVPGHLGAGPFRFASVQPLAALLACPPGPAGKSVLQKKDFPPPIWISKGLVFWRILLGKWKRPCRVAFPFSKIDVQLSWTPLPPIVLPDGKTDFLWGRRIANDILKSETKDTLFFKFEYSTFMVSR